MSDNQTAREAAVNELKQIYQVLFDDIAQAEKRCSVAPSAFADRTFVRTYFAYVEGVAYLLRRITLASLDGLGVLTVEETATLREQKLKKQGDGKETLVPAFQTMKDSLRFTLRCYAKNHGIKDYEPELGSGWQSMLTAIKVRDRLMHPKSVVSLTLTPAEVACINEARKWWHGSVQELLIACEREDKRILAILDALESND